MRHYPAFHSIKIEAIQPLNDWNIHPFITSQPSTKLYRSIKNIGLLHPPIVLKRSDGSYHLICGRARLEVYQQVWPNQTMITALILDEDTNIPKILACILKDQLVANNISLMEKAYFFEIVLKHMELEEAIDNFAPSFPEKIHAHRIQTLQLLLKLETDLQMSVHEGKLGEKTALELLKLVSQDRLTLHSIFQTLELGGGKQKRLLALSKDLAFRQDKSITDLLATSDFKEILDHPEMNHPQKVANLFSTFQKQLFPQSRAAEESFLKNVTTMNLPESCTVSHSPAFEKEEVSIVLHFKSLKDLEQRVSGIKELMDNK